MAKPIRKMFLLKEFVNSSRRKDGAVAFSYIVAEEFGTLREDGHRAWRAAMAMGEVGKTGRRIEHVVVDVTSVRKGSDS